MPDNPFLVTLATTNVLPSWPRPWVDDDEELRPLLAGLLARVEGIECCREFASPQALLAALRQETAPDLILLDMHLGAQNGIDFIRPIKALAPATRVVVMSIFCDSLKASRALQAGASGYLLKIAVPEQILAHLPAALPRLEPTLGFRGPPRLRARQPLCNLADSVDTTLKAAS